MATRNDVAKLAGVSAATVSRVINNIRDVSPELRERVIKAVDELSYRPNLTARGLKLKKSFNIAYLIPDIIDPFYTEIFRGINRIASTRGYICSLIEYTPDWFENLSSDKIDGIICAVELDDKLKKIIADMHVPVVLQTDRHLRVPFRNCVVVSHNLYSTMLKAFNYIIDEGHTKIGLIIRKAAGNPKLKALREVLNSRGIEFNQGFIEYYSKNDYHYIAGYEAMERLLERKAGVTAVAVQNDMTAIGAVSAAVNHGLRVPDDISFLGCDDTVAARFCNPPLSTIKLYKEKQGLELARILLDMIERRIVMPYEFKAELIIRKSIANIKKEETK